MTLKAEFTNGKSPKAVMYENKDRNANYKYIGIELTEEYLPVSKARIEYAISDDSTPIDNEVNEVVEKTPSTIEQTPKSVSLW